MKEHTHIYELVDATDEERYYPLGIEFDLTALIQAAEQHDPSCWEMEHGAMRWLWRRFAPSCLVCWATITASFGAANGCAMKWAMMSGRYRGYMARLKPEPGINH